MGGGLAAKVSPSLENKLSKCVALRVTVGSISLSLTPALPPVPTTPSPPTAPSTLVVALGLLGKAVVVVVTGIDKLWVGVTLGALTLLKQQTHHLLIEMVPALTSSRCLGLIVAGR